MRRKFLLIIVFVFSINAYCQVDHWESLFNSNSTFKYWSSKDGDIETDWRYSAYDDSSWEVGPGGIGYGDGDDATIIDTCNGVFIRKTVTIADKTKIVEALLYIDYDDAFVAYLNGAEIARSAGLSDPFPGILQLSSTQHEAGSNEKYSIDPTVLINNLLDGQNTIAIQIHNASETSSDLSSSAWFFVGVSSTESSYLEVPDWFIGPTSFSSSNLPIIVINTASQQSIPDAPKIDAYMGIINNIQGETNHLSDEHNHFSGIIGIERRGNSTQGFPKKPYEIELRDSAMFNHNASLFGWPAENDFILRASYIDHTFLRNPLAMHMSREMGRWASRCKLVEVILNGEYIGIYILMEKIKRDPGRLDLADLYSNEIHEPGISGGYIYEISGFNNTMGESRHLRYPTLDSVAPEQMQYIQEYDNSFRDAMRSPDYMNDTSGYSKWIDVGSFIDELLVQESMRNSDAYGWSGYFHKDKERKINAGPVWDFDQSAGNSSYPDNGVLENWMFSHPNTTNTPFFWPLLFEDPDFRYHVRYRWERLREGPFQTSVLLNYIDSLANLLSEPKQREFEKWPVLGANIWREASGYAERNTYQKEIDYLKSFLTSRWAWMDQELAKYENPNTIEFTSSNLPIFVINTEYGQQIPNGQKIDAYMGIVNNSQGIVNQLSDEHNHYSGFIGIEHRANPRQDFPKKPYVFETRDREKQNRNISLFGWPAENDYILRASYLDHTFLRSPLAMHMSRELGRWGSRCKFVELVLNGEYIGIYILMETIKRDQERVNIAELSYHEITEPYISGGYIYEISGVNNTLGESRHLIYPPYNNAAPEQIEYITQFDNSFREVMHSIGYKNDTSGYSAWIDVGSFIDEILVQEAMRNSDAYGWGGYFHKNRLGKIKAGPVWDFDQSAGNSSYPDDGVIEKWIFSHPNANNTPFFWPLLFDDPVFSYEVRSRWEEMREGPFQSINLVNYIDSMANLLSLPKQREFEKWPVLGANIWKESAGYSNRDTYQKEVDHLKVFLLSRWAWMDQELAKYENPNVAVSISSTKYDITAYPNPARDYIIFDLDSVFGSAKSISIYNQLGMIIQSVPLDTNGESQDITLNFDSRYRPGLYLFKINFNDSESHIGRFFKIE